MPLLRTWLENEPSAIRVDNNLNLTLIWYHPQKWFYAISDDGKQFARCKVGFDDWEWTNPGFELKKRAITESMEERIREGDYGEFDF